MGEDATGLPKAVSQTQGTPENNMRSPAPPRRRRHWARWLAAGAALLVILLLSLPYLASTGAGTRLSVRIANRWIPGKLSVENVSLRWLGPCRIEGGRLSDLQGREVIRFDDLTYGAGLWGAIRSWEELQELRIGKPYVCLFTDQDGHVSLRDALISAPATNQEEPASALPLLKGSVLLQDGCIRIVSSDGQQMEVSDINASCTLNALNNVEGTLSMQLPRSGKFAAEVKLRNLAPGGRLQPLEAEGTVGLTGDADLGKLLEITSCFSGRQTRPAIAGRLAFQTDCSSSAEAVQLAGTWTIDGLEMGTGDKRVREKQMRLITRSTLRRQPDRLSVDQFSLDSGLLALKLAGNVSEFSGAQRLSLVGEYSGSWDAITALIHELVPASGEVMIAGTTGSRFEISGPVWQPNVRPPFQELATAAGLSWDSASGYGLHLGKGKLSPALKQGQLAVPFVAVPLASGGQIHLGGVIDFHSDEPTLSIRDRTQLVDNVPITPELGKSLLSRVNPVFGELSRAEGTASLSVEGVALPMSEAIKHRGAGRGRLDFRDLKIAPAGLLTEAIALGGLGSQDLYTVKAEGLDFTLNNGRLHYDNFALVFADGFDLRFRGSVGFDDTLDLTMSVPVRPALLKRCGIAGPVNEYARLLSDARVEIPILGTRSQPKFDVTKVNVKPLIERALAGAAQGKAGDLLKNLGGAGQLTPGEAPKAPSRAARQSPAASAEKGALDLLGRSLKGAASRPVDNRKPR